jgi:hypothetical protein
MNILLVGEFSGLHLNLKAGLEKLGCHVDLISYGDSWKKINGGINLSSTLAYPFSLIADELNLRMVNFSKKNTKYDVVQFINPLITNTRLQIATGNLNINKNIIKRLIDRSKKSFLLAAGDDHYYFKLIEDNILKYNPIDDAQKIDWNARRSFYGQNWKNPLLRNWNIEMVNMVTGVIPCAYEYETAYKHSEVKNKKNYIPFPFNTSESIFYPNKPSDMIKVVYSRTRDGFKGTQYIMDAFKLLSTCSNIKCIILDKMPLSEYLKKISGANIVIDQVNSYSYAYTALTSLAEGRIVLSGYEDVVKELIGGIPCPSLFNIIPNPVQIANVIQNICEETQSFIDLGLGGREYVLQNHDSLKIANIYLKEWDC